ncbi:MAG: AraC family transcriptional regulator ligand-binding domain-containing protein [Sandaracinaceae bacterium]|nr:AraC family transcriptional regulator ligand-binding domain-containing protein [Sandaracinaceae bacterium]
MPRSSRPSRPAATAPHLHRPTVSVAYLNLLVEMLAERGIDASRLFAGIPFDRDLLTREGGRMSAADWTRFVLRAQELTADPGLGYAFGLRMRPGLHGILGYAALSSATIRDSLEVSARYANVRQAHFRMALEPHEAGALFTVREKFPIPVARTFFYENILVSIAEAVGTALGRPRAAGDASGDAPALQIWMDTPEPPYFAPFRERLPPVRFGAVVNGVAVPHEVLALRPVLADPHASREAIAHCERELALTVDDERDLVIAVRDALGRSPDGEAPRLTHVAATLGVSTRTLKRKLAQGGTSFRALLLESQLRRARHLLAHTQLRVAEVAHRLGYENPANFSRAFTQSTGESPSAYRARTAPSGLR